MPYPSTTLHQKPEISQRACVGPLFTCSTSNCRHPICSDTDFLSTCWITSMVSTISFVSFQIRQTAQGLRVLHRLPNACRCKRLPLCDRPTCASENVISTVIASSYMICVFNRNLVDIRWQQYITHLHTTHIPLPEDRS
jgi:hypothetical protein